MKKNTWQSEHCDYNKGRWLVAIHFISFAKHCSKTAINIVRSLKDVLIESYINGDYYLISKMFVSKTLPISIITNTEKLFFSEGSLHQ